MNNVRNAALLLIIALLPSCKLASGIFRYGFYAGIFMILSILVLAGGFYYYLRRRS